MEKIEDQIINGQMDERHNREIIVNKKKKSEQRYMGNGKKRNGSCVREENDGQFLM